MSIIMIFPYTFLMYLLEHEFMHLRWENSTFDGKITMEIAYTNIAIYHINHEIISVETF